MKKLIIMFLAATLMWGCYPAGPEYAEDLDVVYTTFDEAYDFQAGVTYAMPDSIVVDVEIDNDNGVLVPDTMFIYMNETLAKPILDAIKLNMANYGWTRVIPDKDTGLDPATGLKPNLILTPAAIKSTTYFYSYWYHWYYGGWYGGYWGWYYPPYYTVSSYTTGSLIITMTDPSIAEESPIGSSPTAWVAVANGLYTGAYDLGRATTAIDQALAQSSYLNTTN